MAQMIVYCDRCSRMIPPVELAAGEALVAERTALCAACARSLTSAERSEILGTPLPAKVTPPVQGPGAASGRKSYSRRTQAAPPGRPVGTLAGVGLGAGALIVIVAVVMMSSGQPAGSGRRRESRDYVREPVVSPVAPVPPTGPPGGNATPAPGAWVPGPAAPAPGAQPGAAVQSFAARLEEIRKMRDPLLDRYAAIRSALNALLADAPEAPEAEEARKFLADVEAEYVNQAEEALKSAEEAAGALASRGDHDGAVRAFGYVRLRFGDSDEWRFL